MSLDLRESKMEDETNLAGNGSLLGTDITAVSEELNRTEKMSLQSTSMVLCR